MIRPSSLAASVMPTTSSLIPYYHVLFHMVRLFTYLWYETYEHFGAVSFLEQSSNALMRSL